jgi:hypothetical protein
MSSKKIVIKPPSFLRYFLTVPLGDGKESGHASSCHHRHGCYIRMVFSFIERLKIEGDLKIFIVPKKPDSFENEL